MSLLHRYSKNLDGRDFFTTDIHGNFDLLHEEMQKVAFDTNKDRLFVGGDSTDRGPHSDWILDYVNEPWFISVRGNHCEMYISAHEDEFSSQGSRMLLLNGGEWAFDLYEKDKQKAKAIYESFLALPYAIELESRSGKRIGIVHAEVPTNDWSIWTELENEESEMNLLHHLAVAAWARTRYDYKDESEVKNIDVVLSGHTPTKTGTAEKLGNQYFCDLGSFFRGKLGLFEIE